MMRCACAAYIAIPLLGGSQLWQRAPADLLALSHRWPRRPPRRPRLFRRVRRLRNLQCKDRRLAGALMS